MQDAEIIARIRSGETDAWRLLFDKYGERLLRLGTSMGLSDADAEEVVNDVFLNAFSLLRDGKLKPNVGPWLREVMKNQVVDRYRQNLQHIESEPFEEERHLPDDQRAWSKTPMADRQRFKRAWQQFTKSNPRSVSPSTETNDADILAWVAHHATNEELADYLRIDPNAARVRKHRALARFKRLLASLEESPGEVSLQSVK